MEACSFVGGGIRLFTENRICRLLGIKYPLLQGGMAGIAGGQLAAAVSNAGGIGTIGAGGANREWLQKEIAVARSLTNKPFAVNLMLANSNVAELVEVVIDQKVSLVTTGGGNPGPYLEKLKSAGIKVIPVVSSPALAKRLARLGADALIAEGMESGGHVGEISTMCLVPMITDGVDIPVIAAGGIFDGRGVAASFVLGAEGVQIGTRFICARECNAHPLYKEKILAARERATVVCGQSTGHPVRALHNKFTRQYLEQEFQGMPKEELAEMGRGKYPAAALNGDIENGSILAGQAAAMITEIQTAAEIVNDIVYDLWQIKKKWEDNPW